ncbi:MAG: 4-carboxy-4-hydroxy-2-oxoadipate aldolase/oxaloacetate decarboxylase [Pararhodobacter sp.]|nr:4-carboxy-4-hydroxy-2-oxoadipate aldolase/oxaloacetate decarboxylase [Pararhodobacter sp.]
MIFDATRTTTTDFSRVAPDLANRARGIPIATLHEAGGKVGFLPSAIKPITAGLGFAGPALTVQSPGGDNLWLHRALEAARPGDVMVVHTGGAHDFGYWGEIMSTAARARGLAGVVIDGGVRDGALLTDIGLPVFARGISVRGTGKDFGATGWIGAPLLLGCVVVQPGDLIVGDADGVICVPQAVVARVLDASAAREEAEQDQIRRLEAGETTMEIFGFHP